MGITNRPYAGTWVPTGKQLVQYTPDCLVFINGDTSLPGCTKCNGRIDLQQFIINVSVDAGIDAGGASASVSLSIPKEFGNSIYRNNKFIITPGLEVHIYMRGYFPYKGLYAPKESRSSLGTSGELNLSESVVHPYYHVFHGVIVQSSFDYSGGFYSGSFTCSSMLHFWSYQPITTNASVFGARPSNSKMKASLVGHNFTAMTPFAIIYSLYKDVNGAAGGVGFTASQKSNVNSANPINPDQSLYSLSQLYWEKRFSTKVNNLRMYGASGTLFNSAQQSFISKLSTQSANRIVALQYRDPSKWPNDPKDPFNVARALDLIRVDPNGNVIKPFDVQLVGRSRAPTGRKNKEDFGINVAAIQAYVRDIGQYGNVNLFESTYETKLDIANRVTEVTGFEFYQDVDGDYVFKPPFYNMDTSDSRIYQLKPIDIISVAPDTKEPEVTYMVAKGGAFKNMVVGGGLENEWGVSGKYYDWRLISQYGWREGSFETKYLNSAREMFWAAVNRLDIMNASINSANATIPLRPELRPGFPVFIEHLDSFYYVNGINHSFSYGGQCTSSLTLEARRARFDAPGNPRKEGIDSIDLSNVNLPPKPLSTLNDNGQPKLTGFPNVVMALDPNQINPAFFVVGSDLENINTPGFRKNLIAFLRQSGSLEFNVSEIDGLRPNVYDEDTSYVLTIDPDDNTIIIDPAGQVDGGDERKSLSQKDFAAATARYDRKVNRRNSGLQSKIAKINGQITVLEQKISRARGIFNDKQREAKLKILNRQLNGKRKALQGLKGKLKNIGNDETIGIMLDILEITRKAYFDQNPGAIENMNTTANILDVLSDKKASFSNGSIPGVYRYYSSAHPNPNDQGQRVVNMDETVNQQPEAGAIQTLDSPIKTKGFLRQPRVLEGGVTPEAELGLIEVRHGLNILKPGKISNTERVPTRNITELTFVEHYFGKNYDTNVDTPENSVKIPKKQLIKSFKRQFIIDANKFPTNETETLSNIWGERTSEASQTIQTQLSDLLLEFAGTPLGDFIGDPYNRYSSNEYPEGSERPIGSLRGRSLKKKINGVAAFLARNYATVLSKAFKIKHGNIVTDFGSVSNTASTDSEEFIRRRNEAYANLSFDWNTIVRTLTDEPISIFTTKSKGKRSKKKTKAIYSPVFPVSDHKGYEVIGSYRYGRGLSIEAGGDLESILFEEDPLQYQDINDVENLVESLVLNNIRRDEDGGSPSSSVRSTLSLSEKAKFAASLEARDENGELLIQNPTDPTNVDATQFDVKFSNWIETAVRSQDKLTVANKAFRLSDLSTFVDKTYCECRAEEADVDLSAFGIENFLIVEGETDRLTQYQKDQAVVSSVNWSAQQQAYRGEILGRDTYDPKSGAGPNSFVNDSALERSRERLDQALENLDNVGVGDDNG